MIFLLNPFRSALLLSLLLIASNTVMAATPYQVDALQHLGATPTHMNNKGEAIGELPAGEEATHVVYWNAQGQVTDITPLSYSYRINPAGISDAGDVVYGENNRIYSWNAGVLTDLGNGYPYAVNENNQIVGQFGSVYGILTNGNLVTLPLPADASFLYPTDINVHGDVVGYAYYAATKTFRAFLWSNGVMQDLGTLPGDNQSYAYGVNDQRQIVGNSKVDNSSSRAFLWENGVMRNLALPGNNAYASGINNASQVIGTFSLGASDVHPYLWKNDTYKDLTLVFAIPAYRQPCVPTAINNNGQILARCDKEYRITPVAQAADLSVRVDATPFPATVGLPLVLTSTVYNIGNLTASNITFTQAMPASGYSLVSMIPSQGTCSGTTPITCELGALAADASATITVTVTPTVAGYFNSIVTASARETEVNLSNQAASTSVPVYDNNADVRVDSLNSQTSAARGSNITYKWVVRNTGPNLARAVTLKDTLPNGLTLVSATTTAGSCSGTTTVTCNLGDIRYAFQETVAIIANANVRGTFTNKATASSTTPDSYTVNNTASVTTRVR